MLDQPDISNQNLKLSKKDFQRLSGFIYKNFGINLGNHKHLMLESRLQKRLKSLNINSFSHYCDFLFSDTGVQNELLAMIDVVTTNKTDFFRESAHFEYLSQDLLPRFMNERKIEGYRVFKFWSAGCSTGEEPYTLAMILNEFKEKNQNFHYSILASDISTSVLQKANTAVYEMDKITPIPNYLKKKYLLRNKDKSKKLVRIVPELREKVEFRRINFLDQNYGINDLKDVIICRNVIIYFDRSTQERVINNLVSHLVPGGYFISGHSETLSGMNVPIKQVAPTIYRKIP